MVVEEDEEEEEAAAFLLIVSNGKQAINGADTNQTTTSRSIDLKMIPRSVSAVRLPSSLLPHTNLTHN